MLSTQRRRWCEKRETTLMLCCQYIYMNEHNTYFKLCILFENDFSWLTCTNVPSQVISIVSLTDFLFSLLQIYPEIDFANCPKMLPDFHFSKRCSCTTIHCDRFRRRFEVFIHYRFWIYGKLKRRKRLRFKKT